MRKGGINLLVASESYYGTYGSNAYKPQTAQKTNVKHKKNVKKKSKTMRSLLLISIFCAIGFIIVYRYAVLTELANSVNKQKQMLSGLEKTRSQLRTEMMIDLKTVDDVAKNKLGMDRPYSYQIEYVNLGAAEGSNKVAENQSAEKSFVKKINKIVEFLY